MNDRNFIASELRGAIAYYTEITVNEQLNQEPSPEGDAAWDDIKRLIDQLVKG
jgi:hypothetical protein